MNKISLSVFGSTAYIIISAFEVMYGKNGFFINSTAIQSISDFVPPNIRPILLFKGLFIGIWLTVASKICSTRPALLTAGASALLLDGGFSLLGCHPDWALDLIALLCFARQGFIESGVDRL